MMDLANTTPLTARLDVGPVSTGHDVVRVGTLLAKATFRWDERGDVQLDTQHPEPVLLADAPHPLGTIPRDDLEAGPFGRDVGGGGNGGGIGFEMAVLGCAHAPGGAPAMRANVAISLGGRRAVLAVFGDRTWVGEGAEASITPTEPFVVMPLVPERAFGGAADVEIDDESFLAVVEPRNPLGRGFDPTILGEGLSHALRCPPPFPRWDRRRLLPNIEHPERLIARPSDAPDPAGWSPWPLSSPHAAAHGRMDPELCFESEPAERCIRLEGLTPGGDLVLQIPRLALVVDAAMGTKRATRPLPCIRWVLRIEERLLTATYRLRFSLAGWEEGQSRSMRLRLV